MCCFVIEKPSKNLFSSIILSDTEISCYFGFFIWKNKQTKPKHFAWDKCCLQKASRNSWLCQTGVWILYSGHVRVQQRQLLYIVKKKKTSHCILNTATASCTWNSFSYFHIQIKQIFPEFKLKNKKFSEIHFLSI